MSDKVTKKIASSLINFDIFDKNPWAPFESGYNDKEKYREVVRKSRFFYREDPFIFSVINRLADIAVTEIVFDEGTLKTSEFELLKSVSTVLASYLKDAVRELLLSGLLYTEVYFDEFTSSDLRLLGIRYKRKAVLPKSIAFRNPEFIEMFGVVSPDDVVYFYEIPKQIIDVINNPDKEEHKDLFSVIKSRFPKLIRMVREGKTKIQITPKYRVIRLNSMTDSVYPVPYLAPVIPLLEHKRNIRRMDYAMAARAPLLIMHVRAGNDDYPVAKDDEDIIEDLRRQIYIPEAGDMESYSRIYQLITNHTIEIDWVYPPIEALLDTDKYIGINEEILLGLGIPRMILTGEAQRTQAGFADITDTVIHTMISNIRRELLILVKQILYDIITNNNFKGRIGEVRFEPIRLHRLRDFFEIVRFMYETGNLSRRSLAKFAGYDIVAELRQREKEEALMEERGLTKFAPVPYGGKADGQN